MKPIPPLLALTIIILLLLPGAASTAYWHAATSPLHSPIATIIPICPRCTSGNTVCDQYAGTGGDRGWITVKHDTLEWCKICSYDPCKSKNYLPPVEPTPTPIILPNTGPWQRLPDDWMGLYPLYQNPYGAYCVEIDGIVCTP